MRSASAFVTAEPCAGRGVRGRDWIGELDADHPPASRSTYWSSLQALARSAAHRPWADVIERADGAHPLEILRADPSARTHALRSTPPPQRVPDEHPELHYLEAEWYFTTDTSRRLADEFLRDAGALALGCPTVAREAARKGHVRPLIDASSSLPMRMRLAGLPSPIRADLLGPLPLRLRAEHSRVVLDPPWHLGDMLTWLTVAGRVTRRGGIIAFPLYRALTKPNAGSEREAILDHAGRLGAVRVHERAIRYATPGFEHEAGLATGVPIPLDWRLADLVTVVRSGSTVPAVTAPAMRVPEVWRTWVIDGQVIKVRRSATSRSHEPASPLAGTVDDVVPSVSRRWPGMARIGLLTSRQRAASVADPVRIGAWLDAWQREGAPPDGCHPLLTKLLTA